LKFKQKASVVCTLYSTVRLSKFEYLFILSSALRETFHEVS
jgi:hypothetical protein